jgi:hypothetical protein
MYTKRLLVSQGEERLYSLALSLLGGKSSRVHLKTRLADVFDIDLPVWTQEERTFMLQAHFDVLITDIDFNPDFAIEFDGGFHSEPRQAQRDILKDSICRKAYLPIKRVKWHEYSNMEALAREIKDIDQYIQRAKEDERIVERILCMNLTVDLLIRLVPGPWNSVEQHEQMIHDCFECFYRTGYLRVTREDTTYYYNDYSAMGGGKLPPGSSADMRYNLLKASIRLWKPSPDEDYADIVDILVSFAKLMETSLVR